MLYLTQTRLMLESERTVVSSAMSGDEAARRVCSQLLADTPRYRHWHVRHEDHMLGVARARRREQQIQKLRSIAVEQVHRTALVRYLRDNNVTGVAREQTLREFYGLADPRDSALAEHRTYLMAASTQLCTGEILELVGDQESINLLRAYEQSYAQYFGMFCERARAAQSRKPYLLASLLPEARAAAGRLRLEILDSQLTPLRPVFVARQRAAQSRGKGAKTQDRPRELASAASHGPNKSPLRQSRPARAVTLDRAALLGARAATNARLRG